MPARHRAPRAGRLIGVLGTAAAVVVALLPATAASAQSAPAPEPTTTVTPTATPAPVATPSEQEPAQPPAPAPAPEPEPAPETSAPVPAPEATEVAEAVDVPSPETTYTVPPVAEVERTDLSEVVATTPLEEKDAGGDVTVDVADPGNAPYPESAAGSGAADGASGSRFELSRPAASIVPAAAVVGFRPGNIISDAVFANRNAMTAAQIASFINGKVASCKAGYTCLEEYVETTRTRKADAYCSQYTGGSRESAARIIHKVSQACGINPRVLLVMLQKEQGLVTHTWPSDWRFTIAMGMGCPDTADCDKTYYGFFNQVYGAARQMKIYSKSSYFNWYAPGGTRSILYHPNKSCGSSGVYVQNQATANLYYYTPYQPNRASIAAGFGTGDSCSSYGNRNFYNYFRAWFGSTGSVVSSRVYGDDRYATSADLSSRYTAGAPVAYVASGADYADALSAAPAAATLGGPLLLTMPKTLPASVRDELRRLKPKRIVVVGGTGAVSSAVYRELAKIQPNIRRDAGADRYATSRVVNQRAFPGGTSLAYVATGRDFPDALSAAVAAGALRAPVVLVNGKESSVGSATLSHLKALKVKQIRIAGGTGVVSPQIQAQLAKTASVTRLAGADRYATSVEVNRAVFQDGEAPMLAVGTDFADALSGAAYVGRQGRPLLVVQRNCLPASTYNLLGARKTTAQTLLGGPEVLGRGVVDHAVC
ncbi:cell wall-binding repeat-containing protein [Microbacterium sp. JZ31]|uniref:cell wall-binding repeat-containing protein n=1 Tax=Microbacterium sp. JZ31 TaxID=1906274 RepID=UPI001934532B|nr:cell wall-binding repeat-containing protein [Microbacterium sp. JZ31]